MPKGRCSGAKGPLQAALVPKGCCCCAERPLQAVAVPKDRFVSHEGAAVLKPLQPAG